MDKKMIVRSSAALGEDLEVIAYGSAGQPIVAFATQGQAPENFEEVGLVDELADYLDAGVIQLFCVNNVDNESWGGTGYATERAARQEAYYTAICDELVPLVHEVSGSDARPLALGFDLGATHAAIFALRRPDLFQGCICLSGVYDARRYFGDWMDATLYDNTPCAFLPNMTPDHPYVEIYNKRQLLFCTGQEASEAECLRTTREIDANLVRLGVEAWCDYWGGDVSHTWFWWKKQIRYFLPIVLEDVEKTTAAEKISVKKAPARKRTTIRKTSAAKRATAKKAEAEKDVKAAAPAEKDVKPEATAKAPAKKAAATKAAPKAAAKKAAAAEAEPKAAEPKAADAPLAKAEKPAVPAKATKAATPVKAEKPAAPAKKPATARKPAAKAEPKAAEAPVEEKKTATKTAAKAATATTKATTAAAKPAAKKAPAPKAATTKKRGTSAK